MWSPFPFFDGVRRTRTLGLRREAEPDDGTPVSGLFVARLGEVGGEFGWGGGIGLGRCRQRWSSHYVVAAAACVIRDGTVALKRRG